MLPTYTDIDAGQLRTNSSLGSRATPWYLRVAEHTSCDRLMFFMHVVVSRHQMMA